MEEHFKNKLNQHKIDWNKEELLPNLELALLNKKRNSRKVWYILVPLLLLIIPFWCTRSSKIPTNMTIVDEVKPNNEQHKINQLQPIILKNHNHQTNSINEITSDEAFLNKINYTENKPQTLKANTTRANLFTKKSNVKIEITENRMKSTFSFNDELLIEQNLPQAQHSTGNTQTKNILPYLNQKEGFEQFDTLVSLPKLKIYLPQLFTPNLPIIDQVKTFGASSNPSSNISFFIEPNVKIGLMQRKFWTPYEWAEAYIEEKRRLEKSILYNAFSFEVGALLNEKWSMQIGLEYQEMREQFKHDILLNSDTTFIQFDKAYYAVDSNMDTTFFAATRPIIDNEIRKIKHWNKHNYINIPFTIGRRFCIGETMFNASVGISYALRHNFKGRTKGWHETIEENEIFQLKNRIGFQVGIGAEYLIRDNKVLFFKTTLRKHPTLNSFVIEGEYGKSHLSYSIGLGMRFYLHSKK